MRFSRAAFGSVTRGATIAALLALACLPAMLAAQEVYRSVDASGHVVYSDRGGSKTAPRTTLHVNEPDPAEVARLAHEQQLLDADEAARARTQAVEDKSRVSQQHKKQQACEKARTEYYHMKDSARLYKRDAEGNRVYYNDDDADALREQARRAMLAACGS
ncbi:MAG: DUF4124 domain-containing protein [Gammaproteobacteria bacterium]|nr:DUF4124 domain-containing protein [Gammaproteobacteria bacterium]MBV9727277.1 DUF4124 domain-containing protein [Gammaproteobacteria bacterium]